MLLRQSSNAMTTTITPGGPNNIHRKSTDNGNQRKSFCDSLSLSLSLLYENTHYSSGQLLDGRADEFKVLCVNKTNTHFDDHYHWLKTTSYRTLNSIPKHGNQEVRSKINTVFFPLCSMFLPEIAANARECRPSFRRGNACSKPQSPPISHSHTLSLSLSHSPLLSLRVFEGDVGLSI